MDLAKAARDSWFWGQNLLFLLVGLGAPLLPRHLNLGGADFMLNRVDPTWVRWLGAPLLLAGLLIAGWGMRSLGRSLTPGTEPLPGGSLVTSGPYARVRHPIYTGVVLVLAGYTLGWSNWTLALIVGLVALQYFEGKARREERWMAERFPDYEAYMRRVPRRVM